VITDSLLAKYLHPVLALKMMSGLGWSSSKSKWRKHWHKNNPNKARLQAHLTYLLGLLNHLGA
jgi:hypothetical protein